MERCREGNLKLNKDKLKLKLKEAKLIGHLITNEGLKATTTFTYRGGGFV
jgi:hypothetical protein